MGASQWRSKGGNRRTRSAAVRRAKAQRAITRGPRRRLIGHIGAADEGSGEDHAEAEGETEVAPGVELFGTDVVGHGEVAAGGLEVLADGRDLGGAFVVEVGEKFADLVVALAESDHQAGFGEDRGAVLAGETEDTERLAVAGLRANARVEARDGFHIVVEDVGGSVEDRCDGVEVAAEVGCKDFDAGLGQGAANFAHGGGEVGGAAVGQVVAIDAGDDHVAEAHGGGDAGDVGGLVGVEGETGFCFGDGAEAAAASAEVAEDHEGRLAAVEALVDVGAAGGFADGVEVEAAQVALEGGDGLEMGGGFAQPGGQAAAKGGATGRGGVVDLDEQNS